jgi:hypothetical protein
LQHFEGESKIGKNCSLEKRIPLRSKLDTAKMMEAAGKYVKFLEAQVIVGITISSSFFRIGVVEPAIFASWMEMDLDQLS